MAPAPRRPTRIVDPETWFCELFTRITRAKAILVRGREPGRIQIADTFFPSCRKTMHFRGTTILSMAKNQLAATWAGRCRARPLRPRAKGSARERGASAG